MSLANRIKKWLNTKPSEDDLFFVNIRETYQSLQAVFSDKQLVNFFCCAIYVTSLLLLAFDIKLYGYLNTSTLVVGCFAIIVFVLRTLYKQDKDFAVF